MSKRETNGRVERPGPFQTLPLTNKQTLYIIYKTSIREKELKLYTSQANSSADMNIFLNRIQGNPSSPI